MVNRYFKLPPKIADLLGLYFALQNVGFHEFVTHDRESSAIALILNDSSACLQHADKIRNRDYLAQAVTSGRGSK